MKYKVLFCWILLLLSCKDRSPIKVGFISSISGEMSSLGVETRNSIEIFISDKNSSGGIGNRPIELIVFDDENSLEKSKEHIDTILNNQIKFLISAQTSAFGEQLLKQIKDRPVLAISPTMSSTLLSNLDDNFIRICPTNYNQAEALNRLLLTHKKESILIIYDDKNRAYSKDLSSHIERTFQSTNRFSRSIGYKTLDNDLLENIFRELNSNNYDSLLFISGAVDVASICQQLLKKDVLIDKYAGNWAMTGALLERGGKAVEGIYLVHETTRKIEDPFLTQFKKSYNDKFNTLPSQIGTRSYEAIRVLTWAMESSKTLTPVNVKRTLLEKSEISGVLQDYIINSYGDTHIVNNVYRVIDNKFVEMK